MKTDDAMATHSPLQRLPAKLFPLPSSRGVCQGAPMTVLLKTFESLGVPGATLPPIVPDFADATRLAA